MADSPAPSPSSPPEHIRISAEPPRSRNGNGTGHAHTHSAANNSMFSPTSPTVSNARRFSVASAGPRRRNPTNTVTNSKYVTLIPGSEPGLNPEESQIDLHTHCGITVVDFSQDQIIQTELDNETLPEFLREDRPAWSKVRWINLNGLSWDCISAVAKKWNLHRLGMLSTSIDSAANGVLTAKSNSTRGPLEHQKPDKMRLVYSHRFKSFIIEFC